MTMMCPLDVLLESSTSYHTPSTQDMTSLLCITTAYVLCHGTILVPTLPRLPRYCVTDFGLMDRSALDGCVLFIA